MAAPNYQRLDIDLAVARPNPEAITGQGVQYDGLTIVILPGGAGAGVELAFGAGRPFIPMRLEGQTWEFIDVCGNPFLCTEGLFIRNPATAGFLVIFLSTGGMAPSP